MNNSCRCALAILVGAVVIASAVIAAGVTARRVISDGADNSQAAPSLTDMRSNEIDQAPFAGPEMFDRS